MSSKQWLVVAAWVFLPLAASAQQKQPEFSPLDPSAPVNATRYESAFQTYRPASDESQTPDKVWRAVNDEVEKLGGHAGYMKDSGSQPSAPSNGNNAGAKPESTADDHSKHR